MKTRLGLLGLTGMLLLSGCDAVLIPSPMGEAPHRLDAATWQGTWAGDEIVLITTVLNEEQGLIEAAWVERRDQGATFERVSGTVRQTGDWLFLSMEHQQFQEDKPVSVDDETPATELLQTNEPGANEPGAKEPGAKEYLWARVENNGQKILVWFPNLNQFRQAISESTIPGVVKSNDDIILGSLDTSQMERINSPAGGLLNWTDPVVFVRIGN